MPGWPLCKPRLRLLLNLSLALLCLALVAGVIGVRLRSRSQPGPRSGSQPGPAAVVRPAVEVPLPTFATPYRNTGPEVHYVHDAACAQCHPEQAESFANHPMGRSLAPVASVAARQRYDASTHNPFEMAGAAFAVERRGGRVFHKEIRRDRHGKPFAEAQAEVDYVIGSGAHTYSYLIDRGGYLVESPITYYSQKGIWDASPGFRNQRNVFERPIVAECLFCHANRVGPVPDTLNHYQAPLFPDGPAIGCQRCHGPGALHVARRERGEDVEGNDDTIVNPARLPWELREGVCQQCHLEGVKRVLKRGRQFYDYRPGLPWQLFWTVFVRQESDGENRFDSSVEQLYASRCFQASKGRMGCITCHDPHRLPAPAEKVSYYRRRCLQCHDEESGCSLPLAVREERNKADDCRACHMPAFPSSDVPHTAATDHRIRRKPTTAAAAPPVILAGEVPVRPFHPDVAGYKDGESSRALGLALVERADGPEAQMLASMALPLLREAVRQNPSDVPAWEAQAQGLAVLDRSREALQACGAVLARAPRRETALYLAADLARAVGRPQEALEYCRRLRAINPASLFYREGLAKALAGCGDWQQTVAECEAILRQYPPNLEARLLLLTDYVRRGQRDQARRVFEQVLALNPPHEEELRRWFAERMK